VRREPRAERGATGLAGSGMRAAPAAGSVGFGYEKPATLAFGCSTGGADGRV